MTRSSETPPIRVLIVDDSALMRQLLSNLLSSDPDILVVDTASDPLIAREKIKRFDPDVVTLDIEMPRMNGLDFLRKIMALRPTPVIMISSLTQEGADATFMALELGAVDFVAKPLGFIADGMDDMREEIIAKVKTAARSRVRAHASDHSKRPKPIEELPTAGRVIAIGASTGGIPAIGSILKAMPTSCPPIVITQHMPVAFTSRFAARLNSQCDITVKEARNGDTLRVGHAYIARGGRMMRLNETRNGISLVVAEEPKVNGFCPSVDVMFDSVATLFGPKAIGVLLTGMGSDGAKGLLRIRETGGLTLGQDAQSCVVYGMPRAAHEIGAVIHQLPLSRIPSALLTHCSSTSSAGESHHALS